MYSQYDNDVNKQTLDPKIGEDNSLEFIDKLDRAQIKQKLFSRDGGATLNNRGLPFFVNQMKKERLITNNKTLRLRTDRFADFHPSMKPR